MKTRTPTIGCSALVTWIYPVQPPTVVQRSIGGSNELIVYADSNNGHNRNVWTNHKFQLQRNSPATGTYVDLRSAYSKYREDGRAPGGMAGFTMPSIPFNDLYNQCYADIVEKYRESVDLSVDAFQAKQTGRMYKEAHNLYDRARNLKFGSRDPFLKRIGGRYLEWTYGWKPHIQSIFGALDQTMKYWGENPITIVTSARRNTEQRVPFSGTGWKGYTDFTLNARCRMQIELLPPASVLQQVGLYTSLNPASIAWELLPWSFVADWVFNVGGYLRGLETALMYRNRFVRGIVTYGYQASGPTTYLDMGSYPTYWYSGKGAAYVAYKDRQVLSSFPLPRVPVLDFDLGSRRMFNAAALLTSFLGRGSR